MIMIDKDQETFDAGARVPTVVEVELDSLG
jgi:hypothetical protein